MIRYAEKLVHDSTPIPVRGEYDVVVVGGGAAGVAAAMAAGKRGFKTLVIEATSALGGLATMGLVNIPLDYVSGLGVEMFDELEAMNAHWHRNTDPEKHKLVLASALGLGACWLFKVALQADELRVHFNVPDYIILTAFVALGWPKYSPLAPSRMNLKDVTFFDQYQLEG